MRIAVTRRYRFPAAHVLCRDDLDADANRRLYGKCANPAGHGHDYGVEVTVEGPVDPASGFVADPAWLDGLVRERIVERLGHRMLNDEPAFAARVPTAENIALFVREELAPPIAAREGLRLARVRVHETRRNTFETGDPA